MRRITERYRPYCIQWFVGIRRRKEGILSVKGCFDLLENPKDGWLADPFLFEFDGDTYIFAEKWSYIKQKGEIVFSKYLSGCSLKWSTIIEEDYHLSYPYIWKDKNGIHIMPESCGANQVSIYTAIEFPYSWKRELSYSLGPVADSTMFWPKTNQSERWVFTYGCEGIWKDKLIRYKLNGDMIGARRMITRNKKISRPAGKFIVEGSTWYRVAQNGLENYGTGLVFLQIDECSEDNYRETIALERDFREMKVNKQLNVIGMHTYNRVNQWEVVDFRIKKFNLINMLYFVKKYRKFSIGMR